MRIPYLLLAAYILLWFVAAINPLHRDDWLLENVLPGVFLPLLIFSYKRFKFSDSAYLLIFFFMLCHALGAHYTYALVPYEPWAKDIFGVGVNEVFGFERNHYDRLIHFSYGLLLVLPFKEWLVQKINLGAGAKFWLPLEFIVASSALYELMEWAAALVFGGDLGMIFLGAQGDVWDAHWDMFLATLGALIALISQALKDQLVSQR
jgi:putative membrane protein